MQRKIYLYQKNINLEIIELFKGLDSSFKSEKINNDLFVFTDYSYYEEEPINFYDIRELVIEDFTDDFTLYIEPFSNKASTVNNDLVNFLKEISSGVYYLEDLIIKVVMSNNKSLKKYFINEIIKDIHSDTIDSVIGFIESDLNSTKAAKALYLHRNTLNYRLDKFIEKSNINIRTFKGANAIYMLLKYK